MSLRVWQYRFPSVQGEGWAYVMLREDGFFAAVSDYGNYAYLWSSHGHDDFRKFFLRMDWHYIAMKLKPHKRLNADKSFDNAKRYIIEHRRHGGGEWTKEFARDAWEHVQHYSGDGVWEAFLWAHDTSLFFSEPWELGSFEFSPDVVAFAQITVCKRLRDAIAAELAESAQPAP